MLQMILPIRRVLSGKGTVLNDQKVFRVFFLRRLRKIERTSQDFVSVNHHDFIVGNGVFGVNKGRDSGMGHEVRRRILHGALAFVQNHLNLHPAFVSINQRIGNRRAGEGICLHQHVVGRMVDCIYDRLGATAPGGKKDFEAWRRTAPGLWAAGREQAGQKNKGNCSFHILPEYHIPPLSPNLMKRQPKPLQTRIAQPKRSIPLTALEIHMRAGINFSVPVIYADVGITNMQVGTHPV